MKPKIYLENLKYLFMPIPEKIVKETILIPREDLKKRVVELETTVSALIAREEELLAKMNAVSHPSKKFWDEKHEERVITYNARNLPYTNERIVMDVRTFITPEDITVRRWANKHKELVCNNPLLYDDKILSFYKADREDFVYAFDEDTAKVSEIWLFPFELSSAGEGDCEDFSHRMKSRLNALGLPDWRSRVVCGVTRKGEGHSSVYYLADDLKTWVHLNSTTYKPHILADLPTINDEKDEMGIEKVWFSFNKEKSWANFEIPDSNETQRFKYVNVL